MPVKVNPETGDFQHTGSVPQGGTTIVGPRKLYEIFSGPNGERLMSDISQDCINRGRRVPIIFKLMKDVKDRETSVKVQELAKVEQLRLKQLWRNKATGVITEEEYWKQRKEGTIV